MVKAGDKMQKPRKQASSEDSSSGSSGSDVEELDQDDDDKKGENSGDNDTFDLSAIDDGLLAEISD